MSVGVLGLVAELTPGLGLGDIGELTPGLGLGDIGELTAGTPWDQLF